MKQLVDYNNFVQKNKKKTLLSSLRPIHGINLKSIKKIYLLNGLQTIRVEEVHQEMFHGIKPQVEFFYNLEENKIFNNVERKKRIKNYVGMRHILRLPVRGQRTHTNSKTPRTYTKKEI